MAKVDMQFNDRAQIPEGVGLLISILLRYPEVGTIHYCQDKHALKFTFIIKNCKVFNFDSILMPALELYHNLDGRSMRICEIEEQPNEELYSILTITRDVETMTQNEVGLIVEIVKREFRKSLVAEETDLPEDELRFQEEIIGHMLATIKSKDMEKSVIAVREEGRVLVFNN